MVGRGVPWHWGKVHAKLRRNSIGSPRPKPLHWGAGRKVIPSWKPKRNTEDQTLDSGRTGGFLSKLPSWK